MLYTVTPLERVYGDRNIKPKDNLTAKDKSSEQDDLKTYSLSHGRVYVKKKGNDLVIDGIQSTNMADYLKKEYSPGEKYLQEE
jgi:hypothetical protein